MSGMLNPIVLIFILLSAVLSFVVLYNLNNINVSERIRELSTIKVLGFFDREVTMYISRESIVLTIVGILLGYGLGNLLTAYILFQAETEAVVFPLTISMIGYLTATLLMMAFTGIVTAHAPATSTCGYGRGTENQTSNLQFCHAVADRGCFFHVKFTKNRH